MAENINYQWKRFWCPRSGSIRLDWRGYLATPGKYDNPSLVALDQLTDVPCLILLGEPGIGKSQEMTDLVNHAAGNLSHSFVEINLRSCSNLASDLSQEPDFVAWMDGEDRLYLFLDSLDEGLLEARNLAVQIVDEFRKRKYRDKIDRLYLRIACRTAVFPQVLEEGLREIWGKEDTDFYELAPLRQADVEVAASKHGIDAQTFLAEIDRKKIAPFAIKPITLKFLINRFKNHNGYFPDGQSLADIYLDGCRALCEDPNPSRRVGITGRLEVEQRLIVAARIAAVTIFANRFAVWIEPDNGDIPIEDVLIGVLAVQSEIASGNPFPVSENVIREVLDTGLFSSRGVLGRMGWAHQTYAEFLAAYYLQRRQINAEDILNLIRHEDGHLIPQLKETAAWIASMNSQVLESLVKDDPDVLLRNNLLVNDPLRKSIVKSLLKLYESEQLFNQYDQSINYSQLKHPYLVEQLKPYIDEKTYHENARDLAVHIVGDCNLSALQENLLGIVLDNSESIHLRCSSAQVLGSLADDKAREKLACLVKDKISEDKDDRLRGWCLSALWDQNYRLISTQELFANLYWPQKFHFLGSYQIFYDRILPATLLPQDLELALEWLKQQGVRSFGNPFERLGNEIVMQAWRNLELSGVAEKLGEVALVQWREHQHLVTMDIDQDSQFYDSLIQHPQKRHFLIQTIAFIIQRQQEQPDIISYSMIEDGFFCADDFSWLIENIITSQKNETQLIWLQFIQDQFQHDNRVHIDLLLENMQNSSTLEKAFHYRFQPVEIRSKEATTMQFRHQELEAMRANRSRTTLLSPTPRERIFKCFALFESGDLDAWITLTEEMTLRENSTHYGDKFQIDLTKLPGWEAADSETRIKIIDAAQKYLLDYEDVLYDWIGTSSYSRILLAACKALFLMHQELPNFLTGLPISFWEKWTPGLIASPISDPPESYLTLVKNAYKKACNQAISTIIFLIEKDNQEKANFCSKLYLFKQCWDIQFCSAICKILKQQELEPSLFEFLLDQLLEHECSEAITYAESLVMAKESSSKYFSPCLKAFSKHLTPSTWEIIWNAIEQNVISGRYVLESVANRYAHGNRINLTEEQLSDLYIWLVFQYPHKEDPDHSSEILAHFVTERESIGQFRDSIINQLKTTGTEKACDQLQRIINEFSEFGWLRRILAEARKNVRFYTWQQKTPEEFLQLVLVQEPSNLELSNQLSGINQGIHQMADDPKIVTNISNSQVNAPIGNSGPTTSQVTIAPPDALKGVNWANWLAFAGILVAIAAIPIGIFNPEINQQIKQLFNLSSPAKIEPQSTPPSK